MAMPAALPDTAAVPAAHTPADEGRGAPFHAHLAAMVTSPAFAPALGAQIRMLVQHGIGQAYLELNPTEMGPVSVRIEMEGREAHVEFGADLAATRTALQEGLPTLAAALLDSGFTLAGGGVSERQASGGGSGGQPDHRPGGGSGSFASSGDASVAPAPATRAPTAAQRGTVDVFA
jgi:flagellar hook-length control protein FliK